MQRIDITQSHTQAFLSFFQQLQFHQAYQHATIASLPASELLQLYPDLLVEPLPPPQILTTALLGRNVHSITDFIVSSLKQRAENPSAIIVDSPAVQELLHTARAELLRFLQFWHNRGKDHVSGRKSLRGECGRRAVSPPGPERRPGGAPELCRGSVCL